ncbi:MAG TPA: beta-ketoacyl-[acyl-carrier-protein] synthase II [Acidobacteria bacterium]|nr:beta-ketoacyl-[acyl-carrier-protein] synthase II [Acidobacteriota bacterium]
MDRRVVVTGVGIVSPLGVGTEESWKECVAGTPGISSITKFDCEGFAVQIAGEVKGFNPLDYVSRKDVKKMDYHIQYALAASQFALKAAGLDGDDRNYAADRMGVLIGSGIGGLNMMEIHHRTLLDKGPGKVSPFFIPGLIVNEAAGWVSIKFGLKGPNSATCTACTTGSHAIGDACEIIARGDAEVMVAGGTEGVVCALAIDGFAAMRALSTHNDEPERASRPFDADRNGFILGEGAGVLVLEGEEAARKRGAPIVAEIVGYGMSGDAHHISSPPPDGNGAIRVMRVTLDNAGVNSDQVDYINAHGTSTPVGDRVETMAIRNVFGDHADKLSVSSTKSMTGHLLGAAGGVEAGLCVLGLRDQVIPPTINYDTPDPECDLDYVPNEAREASIEYVLSNSFGFGGTNAALLFKRY